MIKTHTPNGTGPGSGENVRIDVNSSIELVGKKSIRKPHKDEPLNNHYLHVAMRLTLTGPGSVQNVRIDINLSTELVGKLSIRKPTRMNLQIIVTHTSNGTAPDSDQCPNSWHLANRTRRKQSIRKPHNLNNQDLVRKPNKKEPLNNHDPDVEIGLVPVSGTICHQCSCVTGALRANTRH